MVNRNRNQAQGLRGKAPSKASPASQPQTAKPRFLDQVRMALRSRHYSPSTEQTYVRWIRQYILFHNKRHPKDMGKAEINAFLTHLATSVKVSASTQNQALSALLFVYRHVLNRKLGDLGNIARARKPKRLPVVLTRDEVRLVLDNLMDDRRLVAAVLYGSGLRLIECLRLRVQDIDFERHEILVCNAKGAEDRVTMLPRALRAPLQDHLRRVQAIHQRDLAAGWGRVDLPDALARKYPNAPTDWRWQWVFPQANRWRDPNTGKQGRHHVDKSLVQKAVTQAVRQAGLTKRASCHTFRHSFATHLLADGYDIRTVQELLGHNDVRATMVYAHVLNRGGMGVRSPMDSL